MKDVWFDPRAEEEFSFSAKYYEEQESGLGLRFTLAVEVALKSVLANPQVHREIFAGCRKCRVVRFPYALIFRKRNEEIEIIALMHLKRQPDYWKGACFKHAVKFIANYWQNLCRLMQGS